MNRHLLPDTLPAVGRGGVSVHSSTSSMFTAIQGVECDGISIPVDLIPQPALLVAFPSDRRMLGPDEATSTPRDETTPTRRLETFPVYSTAQHFSAELRRQYAPGGVTLSEAAQWGSSVLPASPRQVVLDPELVQLINGSRQEAHPGSYFVWQPESVLQPSSARARTGDGPQFVLTPEQGARPLVQYTDERVVQPERRDQPSFGLPTPATHPADRLRAGRVSDPRPHTSQQCPPRR